MVSANDDDIINTQIQDIVINRKGGRCIIDKPPLFSPDQSLLFVISERTVLVYSVTSYEFVKTLKDSDNLYSIVDLAFLKKDDRSLIACSEDGTIVTWKFHAGVQTAKTKLDISNNARILSFKLINDKEALIVTSVNGNTKIFISNITTGKITNEILIENLPNNEKWFVDIAHHGDYSIAAIATNTPFVYVVNLKNPNMLKGHFIPKYSIQCLCWHPSLDILAVGDALGRITLLKSTLEDAPAREVMHWHTLPVSSLAFSKLGGLLISGGAERVVVAWGNANSKRFIPRLPAEILHISASKSHLAVSTADNAIQIVDCGTLYTVGCIKEAGGVGGKQSFSQIRPALQYSNQINSLILPAGPGHLHIYSTQTDILSFTLDVTNTNIVPPERDNLHPEQIEVNLMSVGCNGQWLCTWEGRSEQERIKWWECSPRGWTLHTVVARPHRPYNPAALHMASDVAITISVDDSNIIKFWNIVDTIPGHEGKAAWCSIGKTVGGGDPAGGAALSADGSVAASWSGARLELWNTKTALQKTSLAHPALRPQGRLVQFGRNHHMHFLVCTTDNCLAVWNTLSLRLVWIVQLTVTCLVADPFSDRIATITKNNDVFLFRLNSPHPLATLKKALLPQRGRITSAAFAPSHHERNDFKLYCLREQSEIFLIENSKSAEDASTVLEQLPEGLQPHPSAYSAFIAGSTVISAKSEPPTIMSAQPKKAIVNNLLLTAPSHTQPSLKTICSSVLRALSGTTHQESSERKANDHDATEEKKDVDLDVEKKHHNVSLKKLVKEPLEWVHQLLENDGLTIAHSEFDTSLPRSPTKLSLLGYKLSILLA